MKSFCRIAPLLTILVCLFAFAPQANAQATRTWVSGVGDDVNPCSRTAPCKTFAGAISKTADGGEISVLDPGGFGALTITKSITINGDGILASILVAGTNGIIINAQADDNVIIRNISLNGISNSALAEGLSAIRFINGKSLLVENTKIYGFTRGIEAALSGSGNLIVKDVSIKDIKLDGIVVSTSSGALKTSLDNVHISNAKNGINVMSGALQVNRSTITHCRTVGIIANGGSASILDSVINGNPTGIQSLANSTVRLSNNDIMDNVTGVSCAGGTVASAGNNRVAGDSGAASCAPNAQVLVQ